jgi:hypothetical protein
VNNNIRKAERRRGIGEAKERDKQRKKPIGSTYFAIFCEVYLEGLGVVLETE